MGIAQAVLLTLGLAIGGTWALQEVSQKQPQDLYDEHFPPIQPNCSQSLTDLLLLRQEVEMRESTKLLREAVVQLTQIRLSMSPETHLPQTKPVTVTTCPRHWARAGNTCVLLVRPHKNWDTARQFCQSMGGDLAVFSNTEEFEGARAYLRSQNLPSDHVIWLGAQDLTESLWKWVSGEHLPIGSHFWGTYLGVQEPDGSNRENCLVTYGGSDYMVHDFDCNEEWKTLCQFKYN